MDIKTWTGLSMEESIRMTEDRDKWRKYVEVLPTLGSRTAKDQIRSGRWLITIGAEDNLVRIIGKKHNYSHTLPVRAACVIVFRSVRYVHVFLFSSFAAEHS